MENSKRKIEGPQMKDAKLPESSPVDKSNTLDRTPLPCECWDGE
jgi:hypothetical protein